jgi:hypothetical protein
MMIEKRSQTNRKRMKVLGLAGAVAFVAVGALNLGDEPTGPMPRVLAGSGNAPANTTFVQPTENAMNFGATATWTTPTTVEPIAKAVPSKSGG